MAAIAGAPGDEAATGSAVVTGFPLQLHTEEQFSGKDTAPRDDAGALFVLESKGTWAHAAYHLTAATAGPPLLSLPFALASLGWGPGIIALCIGSSVSFYACYALSLVTEHMEKRGKRSLRYRDLNQKIFGTKWTNYLIAPLQFIACFMIVVSAMLLGGQNMKAMVLATNTVVYLKLYEFIIIFGASTLLLSQLPSFHSLRYLNFISIFLCIGFSICAVIGSIIAGYAKKAPAKDYSIPGTPAHKTFAVFTSISIMINAYANPLIVEIQATIEPPTTGKMFKGLCICYTVALFTFFSVALTGYWAFGNASKGIIFSNMVTEGNVFLVPKWLYFIGNACSFVQLVLASVLFLQPLFDKYEALVADAKKGRFALRNIVLRLAGRSLFVVFGTLLAAMLPFFSDFSAVAGSLAFTPLCIALPLLLHNLVLKPKPQKIVFWVNCLIIVASSVVTVLGGIASMRQILLDAKGFNLFSNL